MTAFFTDQLDYIYFFYGLAFVLLGAVCFSTASGRARVLPWSLLGTFSVVHGISEWLELLALTVGDSPSFAYLRTGVIVCAYLALAEFARVAALRVGLWAPSRWIFVPLIALVVLAGVYGGVNAANATARYAIGIIGAEGSALLLAALSLRYAGKVRAWGVVAALGLAIYGVAAGLVVPNAPLWPASLFNSAWFLHATGLPIQLIRGVLACLIAFSVWRMWTEVVIREPGRSADNAHYLRLHSARIMLALAAIFLFGWALTQYLGRVHNSRIRDEASGDVSLLASRLAAETALVDAVTEITAHTPVFLDFARDPRAADQARVEAVLRQNVEAARASAGSILGPSSHALLAVATPASSAHRTGDGAPGAIAGRLLPASVFERHWAGFLMVGQERRYVSSYPLHGPAAVPLGIAVLEKTVSQLETDLADFDRPFLLADANDIVILSNQPTWLGRHVWPTAQAALPSSSAQRPSKGPVFARQIADGSWITYHGEQAFLRRLASPDGAWSLVLLSTVDRFFASRLLGIVVTLLVATLTLLHLVGTRRLMEDNMKLSDRLALEERARRLEMQATTDPLTGVFNRLKFDQSARSEIQHARAVGAPLCVVLFDLDKFKEINDAYGHQHGDRVLVDVCRIAEGLIRRTDALARWGGEEFIILAPNTVAAVAERLAERLRGALRAHDFGTAEPLTASFGVAQLQAGDTADTLLGRADAALYAAKAAGRNCVKGPSAQAQA